MNEVIIFLAIIYILTVFLVPLVFRIAKASLSAEQVAITAVLWPLFLVFVAVCAAWDLFLAYVKKANHPHD